MNGLNTQHKHCAK